MHHLRSLFAVALFGVAACADDRSHVSPVEPETTALSAIAGQADNVPTRSQERNGTFATFSDEALWQYIVDGDSTAAVGLKAPGANRGVYRGRVLLNASEWEEAKAAVSSRPGITLVTADTLRPSVRVRISSFAAMQDLRRLPIVDYLEPAVVRSGFGSKWASDGTSGCAQEAWTGTINYLGGDILPETFTGMQIPEAWARSNGSGITIGLTDTGIYSQQSEFTSAFASGESGGRWIELHGVGGHGPYDDGLYECGHGTRMAGVIAAPKNGQHVLGVAWRSNLVSVHQADGVADVDAYNARDAIRLSAQRGSHIIVMAWQSFNWLTEVSEEINYWYYNSQVMFVGAAGTSPCGVADDNNVVFPAEKEEVIAVTAVVYPDGYVPCGAHRGPEVDLTAYHSQPTTGKYPSDIWSIGFSSDAAGVVAGVAALVWSQNPGWSRDQVRNRLFLAGKYHMRGSPDTGFGLINAFCAVGGFCDVVMEGPGAINSAYTTEATYTAKPYIGDGSFTYEWSTGETTQSITVPIEPGSYSFTLWVRVTESSTGRVIAVSRDVTVYYDDSCSTCLQ